MSNPYRSFDQLFNSILTAYENAGASGAITIGDDLYRNGAALASTVWGLYKECGWVKDQIYLDTACKEEFVHGAMLRGLQQNSGESYAAFVRRVLARVRTRYTGGNITDCVNWAMEASYGSESPGSVQGYEAMDAYGPGTIVLVVTGTDGGTPSPELLAAVKIYVRSKMAAAPAEIYVIAATARNISISINMTGGDSAAATVLISAFMSSLQEGQPVHPDVFRGFCYQAGASVVEIASPTSIVQPGKFERVVASNIMVNAA